MKFKINGEKFNNILKKTKTLIDNRSNYSPIAKNIYLKVENNNLYAMTTDLENYIMITEPVIVEEEGMIILIHKELEDKLKKEKGNIILNNNKVHFEDTNLSIILTQEINDFPIPDDISNDYYEFNLDKNFVKEAEKCYPYISNEHHRPLFTKLWVDSEYIFASDTRCLILSKNNFINTDTRFSINKKVVRLLKENFKKSDNVKMYIDEDKNIKISDDYISVYSKTDFNNNEFVNYKAVIPGENENNIVVNTKEIKKLLNKLNRDDKINININSNLHLYNDKIDVSLNCEKTKDNDLNICFMNKYLKTLLDTFKNNNKLQIDVNEKNPCKIEDENTIALIIPVVG